MYMYMTCLTILHLLSIVCTLQYATQLNLISHYSSTDDTYIIVPLTIPTL